MSSLAKAARRGAILLATLLVVVAPTQWSLPVAGYNLTLADTLLLIAVPLALLAGARPWRIPWLHTLFLVLLAISATLAHNPKAAAKEWFQLALYFGGGSLLFGAVIEWLGPRALRRGLMLFIASGLFVLALATFQYWRGDLGNPLEVRGSFTNRNVLGGYLSMLLPLLFAGLLNARRWRCRLISGLLVAAGLLVTLSGPAFLVLSLVLIVMSAWRGRLWLVATAAVLIAGFTLLSNQLPRFNGFEIMESLSLYDQSGQPSRRYPEWQAATLMTMERPWVGMGPGAYQEHIGPFYGVVPRETGPTEPDIQNLYLVLAASSGLPAALAFMLMLASAIFATLRTLLQLQPDRPSEPSSEDAPLTAQLSGTLSLGVVGALTAFAVVALWHPLLVRGIGLPLAMLLAAARVRRPSTGNHDKFNQ